MSAHRDRKCQDCDQLAVRWKTRCNKHAKLYTKLKPREAGKVASIRRDLEDYFEDCGLASEVQAEMVRDLVDLMRFHLREGATA